MRYLLLTLVVVGLGLGPAGAGDEDRPRGERSRVEIQATSKYPLLSRMDVQFRGSTVAEGLGLIREALDGEVEFVIEPLAGGQSVPDFTVKRMRAMDVVQLVFELVPDLGMYVSTSQGYEDFDEMLSTTEETETGWDKQTAVVLVRMAGRSNESRELRIFRLADLLAEYQLTIDDVATAIETVWEMNAQHRAASLRFHEGTGLMICSGSPEHIELAQRVLDRIQGEDPIDEREQYLQEKIDSLKSDLVAKTKLIEEQKARIEKLESVLQAPRRSTGAER